MEKLVASRLRRERRRFPSGRAENEEAPGVGGGVSRERGEGRRQVGNRGIIM